MKKKLQRMTVTAAILVVLSMSISVAMATEPTVNEISRITSQVSQEIYSPYCPGKTLAMCPSENASYARQDIQKMAQSGMDAEEIKAELVERYGDGYELIEPRTRDQMTLLGGIVGGLAVAAIAVGVLARRRLTDSDEESDKEKPPGAQGRKEAKEDERYLEELRAEVRE